MPTVVQKFGGSSVADLEKLGKVADLVVATKRRGERVVAVVSAMGKTTENLITLAHQAGKTATAAFEPPRRELDMLVSTGERVSMALLSIAIQARGVSAVSFTGSQSGLITNDRHFDARILEVRPHRIEDELERGHVVIVAGYQGMSYRREITTLGRGGSDTTAVALAAALGADRCEIYSDVDGVYTADPNSVPSARHLPSLDYATLQEMAEAGAKVLNAQAVEWARRHKVAIHARRTADFATGGRGRETLVVEQPGDTPACAVVGDRKLALVSARADAAEALLGAARDAELPLRDVVTAGDRIALTIPLTSVPDPARLQATLASKALPGFTCSCEEFGEISAIGIGAGARPDRLARALTSLGGAARLTVSGPLRVSAVIPRDLVGEAEQRWHALFVEN
ncbi:MAG TPA: aspartate kinase [Polyangiaceae bacterium]